MCVRVCVRACVFVCTRSLACVHGIGERAAGWGEGEGEREIERTGRTGFFLT